MEYTKQTWTAPTGTGLSRYAKSAESASHVTLTLDPENLTNSPTPFTMARMEHMEDGIAKAYDTAPPTPWAQYSGKDIPQLPDNVAGTTYKRDNDWTTTDGWGAGHASITLSVEDETLKVAYDGTRPDTGLSIQKPGLAYNNKFIVGKIKSTVPITSVGYYNGTVVTPLKLNKTNSYETVFYGYSTSVFPTLVLYMNVGQIIAKTCWLESLYVGTGAYDRLVFDNSYHYRHLLNNAVVPTPQGLYFNGATSYLRSKDPVTLPDVFTFSATVNCAVQAPTQALFAQGTSAIPTVPFIIIFRRSNTDSLIVVTSNGTVSIEAFSGTGFFTGLDNTDIDIIVETDFINKTTKVYRNNVQFGTTASAPTMLKPVTDYVYFGDYVSGIGKLLGYMRNICLFDTALTDTQRNWLAQGNTPPILYDVTNYETEGYVSIQDADGTNTGEETDVDSNGNRILKLPSTIKASLTGNVTGNASTASKANVRVSLRHGDTWFSKEWNGFTNPDGNDIWTDGYNIYYSDGTSQYVLNKAISTWTAKTWTGLTDFHGENIWTDGNNIYYSFATEQYVLNKLTSTWVAKTWTGLTNFTGDSIWTDGENIYYSTSTTQYVLDKTTSTWTTKTWTGFTGFNGRNIWTDGNNIYYSFATEQYVLNKLTSTWVAKTWTGLTNFTGESIWTDGDNIYYSYSPQHFVLNKATSTWTAKTWTCSTNIYGDFIWTDGENIYYSGGKVLPATRHNYVDDAKYNSLFGIVTNCNCKTLSNNFVFANE